MSSINITPILKWFQVAKPNPTVDDACTQVGCHIEEFMEMLSVTGDDERCLDLHALSREYKEKNPWHQIQHLMVGFGDGIKLLEKDKIELLDALCDQIVTTIGVAHMLGYDIERALDEVNRSNWSKFVDGKPQLDENGKISKPATYSEPELTGFVK